MEMSGHSHSLPVSASTHQEKRDCYPLDRRLDGAQSRSANDGQEREMTVLLLNKPVACHFTDSYCSSFM
jgi:hypothetical protein